MNHYSRKSFDATGMILQASMHTRMPTIVQNNSNYVNYSQLRKNDQPVLLYGNNCKSNFNGHLDLNSMKQNNPKINIENMLKQELSDRNKNVEKPKIFMQGHRLNHYMKPHPKSHQTKRKHKSHPRCTCESGHSRKMIAN